MTSTPDWLLILTGLGGGVIGSIVTTYGTQVKERREARAQARDALRDVEDIGFARKAPKASLPSHLQEGQYDLETALGEFETSAILARLPRRLITLHSEARKRRLDADAAKAAGTVTDEGLEERTSGRVADQAAQLLASASWHPWTTRTYLWYRTRYLRRQLDAAKPKEIRDKEKKRRDQNRADKRTLRELRRKIEAEKRSSKTASQ